MPDAAPSLEPAADRKRAQARNLAAERARRFRERCRSQDRAQHRRAVEEIGPAIREGEWATDDFDKVEAKWSKVMAGARFVDVAAPRF